MNSINDGTKIIISAYITRNEMHLLPGWYELVIAKNIDHTNHDRNAYSHTIVSRA
jgi:hypothetical protein